MHLNSYMLKLEYYNSGLEASRGSKTYGAQASSSWIATLVTEYRRLLQVSV